MDGCLDVCGPRGTSAFMQPPGQAERISSAGRVPMSLSCVTVCAMGVVELAKGDCELDKFKARSWVGRHRHVTWSVFALAVVAGIRAKAARSASGRARQKSESYCFKWCGRLSPTRRKRWRGRYGDGGISTVPVAATIGNERRNQRIGNYGCRTSGRQSRWTATASCNFRRSCTRPLLFRAYFR